MKTISTDHSKQDDTGCDCGGEAAELANCLTLSFKAPPENCDL